MNFKHQSVLLKETIASLNLQSGGLYVDGTLGGGGHSQAILEATAPDGCLLGLDRDDDALGRLRRVYRSLVSVLSRLKPTLQIWRRFWRQKISARLMGFS